MVDPEPSERSGRTKPQVYQDAKRAGIQGRSKMNKNELEKQLADR